MPTPTNLVLLPGLDGTGHLFAGLLPHLGTGVCPTVIAYPQDASLGYRELIEYTRARLPPGPLVILGESFSGPIAIALAASHPEVRGLIMCCTFARTPWPLPRASARLARLSALQGVGLRLALGRFATTANLQAITKVVAAVPADVIERRLREILTVDVTSELSRLQAPVLSLQASHDRLVPRQPLPNPMELTGPHFLLQHAPEAAARAILAWILVL